MAFERITINSDQVGGVPCIGGLRIPVATVADMVAAGLSDDDILRDFPNLEREDIRESLRYATNLFPDNIRAFQQTKLRHN